MHIPLCPAVYKTNSRKVVESFIVDVKMVKILRFTIVKCITSPFIEKGQQWLLYSHWGCCRHHNRCLLSCCLPMVKKCGTANCQMANGCTSYKVSWSASTSLWATSHNLDFAIHGPPWWQMVQLIAKRQMGESATKRAEAPQLHHEPLHTILALWSMVHHGKKWFSLLPSGRWSQKS